MKRALIITSMLVAALQISAQSNRSRTTVETPNAARKSESTQTPKPAVTPEKKTETRESTPVNRPVRTQERPQTNTPERRVNTSTPSNSREVTRPTSTTTPARSSSADQNSQGTGRTVNTKSTRTETPDVRRESRDGNTNTAPRTVTPSSEKRVVGTGNTESSVNRNAQSSRGTSYTPRTDVKYEQARKAYETPARTTVVRTTNHTSYTYRPVEYRRVHYPYRAPASVNIYWSVPMYHQYRSIYPDYTYWHYPIGYRIHSVSAYDAGRYIGELANVYGRVEHVWYSRNTNEYYLYFGGPYPYQDFSVIIPANIARRYDRRPERFFTNRHIAVTGLVSSWERKPEMLIKKRSQLEMY